LVEHWLLFVQVEPLGLFLQILLMQLYPAAVSQLVAALAVVQLVAQVPPDTHRYPAGQSWVEVVQVPLALHVPAAAYWECVSEGQVVLFGLQDERSWQPPLSHLPVSPQAPVAAAGQVVVSRGVPPDAMFEQVPDLPETLQLWQAPVQEWSQQTFSEEQTSPVEQSLSAWQVAPAPSLVPHWLFVLRQVRLFVQSWSAPQVFRQVGLVVLQT
jgi:hypothetical protein